MRASIIIVDDKADVRVSIRCDDIIFVVVDPGPDSNTETSILYRTSLGEVDLKTIGLGHPGLQLHPAIHTNWDDAVADAQSRIRTLKMS